MSIVKVSKRGQVVIPKPIRDKLGLVEGTRLKAYLENKKIVLLAEPESSFEELQVEAHPEAVREALAGYGRVDEGKIKELLRAIGAEGGGSGD